MGQEVAARTFNREDRQRYRLKVRASLDVFARMLAEARFNPERRSFGLEIELNLTDDAGDPALINAAALDAIADPAFQTELEHDRDRPVDQDQQGREADLGVREFEVGLAHVTPPVRGGRLAGTSPGR